MHKYRVLGKKGEGTFSEVLKCQNIQDGTYYACKKMKQNYQSLEQVNNLREIQAMKRLSPHANILELKEVIFDRKTGNLSLVCELMDMNIYELIRGRRHYLPQEKVKNYIYQLIKALEHMHRNGIFHRDVKPENILIRDDHLKLADFGSCRSVYSKQPFTEYISTRWYRAPECLLTDGYYSYQMDMWSVGCVFYEILSLHPLFPGANEVDQIAKIHDVMGTPDATILNKFRNKARGINYNFPSKKGSGIEKLLPNATKQTLEIMNKLCTYDPDERITAKQVIRHAFFKDLRDADKRKQHVEKKKLSLGDQGSVISEDTAKESHVEGKDGDNDNHKAVRKARRKSKLHESENYSSTLLPKVQNNKMVGHSISNYPTQTFGSTSFPKLHTNNNRHQQSMLPSIANTHYNKHHHTTKTFQPAASKNVYGHFQLPSISKSKEAQF
ncbi:MAPK/MAK/MRK overlapping kinase [Strongylocentrotus purpuratus]|uniref:Protein kinase domain-containing protein n=1 Tax=Strongylocentrotus purpuratus TaxID=7668 RepID=A0A7M7REA4_STRPU|nr:MAPK/MAK/MRK overlapping kinase [Strongylocentrotus purpuratus]|eukprot:XP_786078.1 PREDICTED: MAPK/MAK/MRK overlapping kinase [Strongylocentrotus purpuratus]